MSRLAVILGLVAYTAALSVSPGCLSALTAAGSDPGASQCLATTAFLPVVSAAQAGSSIVTPLDSWLQSMCAAPGCNNPTLEVIVTDITGGCSAELTSLGLPTDAATLTADVEAIYPIFRNVACLTHASTLCVTETLTAEEAVVGPLTVANIVNIIQNPPSSIPSSVVCTDCNKETYNLLTKVVTSSSFKSFFETECGAAFVDGSNPPDITEGANTAVVTGS